MKTQLISGLAFALTSCGNEPPPPQDSGKPVTSLGEVSGSWDIVRFGDYVPPRIANDGVRQAYVNFGSDSVGSHIECNHYSGTHGAFDAAGKFHPIESLDEGFVSTLILCPPEMDRREGLMAGFFRMSPSARWVDDGMVELEGQDGFTILLRRPDSYKLSFRVKTAELEGEWRPTARMIIDENGYSGAAMSDKIGFLRFAGGRFAYDGCPDYSAAYRVTDAGLLQFDDPGAARDGLHDCIGYRPDRLALDALFDKPFVEHAGEGRIVADADGEVIALMKRSAWQREQDDMMAGIVRDAHGNVIQPPPAIPPPLPMPDLPSRPQAPGEEPPPPPKR